MNSLKKVSQKGFTIVELLIVIVVIGILAALVITTYNGIQQKGRNTERTTDLKAIQGQLEAYYAQNGNYPTATQLGAGGTKGANNVAFIQEDMKGLDKEALRDPKADKDDYSLGTTITPGDNKYSYAPTCDGAECTAYTLVTKQEGSEDLIKLESLN